MDQARKPVTVVVGPGLNTPAKAGIDKREPLNHIYLICCWVALSRRPSSRQCKKGSNKAPASLALHVVKIGPKHACTKTKEQV